jgi:phosphoribosylpyrophosphate synthetase
VSRTLAARALLAALLLLVATPVASARPGATPNKRKVVFHFGSAQIAAAKAARRAGVKPRRVKTEIFPDANVQVSVPHVAGKEVQLVIGLKPGAASSSLYQALQTTATSRAEGAASVHVTLAPAIAADTGHDGFVRAMLQAAGATKVSGGRRASTVSRRPRGRKPAVSRQRRAGSRLAEGTLLWSDGQHGQLLADLGRQLKAPTSVVASSPRASGDSDVTLPEDPNGKQVFLLSGKPNDVEDYHGALLQTLRTAWQAKRAGAAGVTVITPYLPYSRADRKDQAGINVGASLMPRLLRAAGVDRVVFFSAHQPQEAGMYEAVGIRAIQVSGEQILAEHTVRRLGDGDGALRVVASSQASKGEAQALAARLAKRLGVARIPVSVRAAGDGQPAVRLVGLSVVAPDAGAGKRARVFAKALARELGLPRSDEELPVLVAEKHRIDGSHATVKFAKPVKGVAVIIDDETASGGTLTQIAAAMPGASRRLAAVTHLNGAAHKKLAADPHLDRLFVTNSVSSATTGGSSKIEIVGVGKKLANVIAALDGDRSIRRWEFLEK